MSLLLSLPHAIWDDVLNSWSSSLGEIVRVDRSFCFTKSSNPLLTVYAEKSYPFPGDACRNYDNVLENLYSWLRLRKVFISHLLFYECKNPHMRQKWKELLSWSGETVLNLTIVNYHHDTSIALTWATQYLRRLRSLTVRDLFHRGCGEVEELLQRNANTLLAFTYEGDYQHFYHWHRMNTKYRQLQCIRWSCGGQSNLCGFLSGCPYLMALNVTGSVAISGPALVSAVTQHCPRMQQFGINCVCRIGEFELMMIANRCPELQYLGLGDSFQGRNDVVMATAVAKLPQLHTLVLDKLAENTLLEIAKRGHPALSIIDADVEFTYAGLQQITAALPQLTGLSIYHIEVDEGFDTLNVLEHGGNLQFLRVGSFVLGAEGMNGVLDSLATNCPQLRVLGMAGPPCSCKKIATVVDNCPLLRKLSVPRGMAFTAARNAKVVLVHQYFELAAWTPEWDLSVCRETDALPGESLSYH